MFSIRVSWKQFTRTDVSSMSNYTLITKLQQSEDGDMAEMRLGLRAGIKHMQLVLDAGNQWLLKEAGVNNHSVFRGR